jgi:tripartite-type tricarboxylate transporter receptor subunit TctC
MTAVVRLLRTAVLGLLTGAMLTAATASANAETWPNRPIKIVVPFAAGGAVDIVARLLSEPMAKALGTTIVVENRAGGAGVPASEAVVRAAPDGYTFGIFSSNYLSNEVTQPHLSFNVVDDITPVSMVVINTVLILVPADSSIHTLKDLVAEAKAKPGVITYGTPGFGTAMHFAGELLNARAGIKMVHVPYRGAAPALTDLLGHHVPVAIMGIGPALPYVKSGKLRAIAITTEKRSKVLPDVPTVAEVGYPGYRFGEWFAMIGPKNIPPDIQNKVHATLVDAIKSQKIQTAFLKLGLEPTYSTPAGLKNFMTTELERIRSIGKQANMFDQKK